MTTTVPTHGGPAVPVSSDTSGKTMGRVALRAYGFPSEADAIAAGFHSEAGPASSVYVVSAADLVSGKYVLEGDPKATPIYTAPTGMRVEGGYSQPVYLVGGSLSNSTPIAPVYLLADRFTTNGGAYYTLDETSGVRADKLLSNSLTDPTTVGSIAGKISNAGVFVSANSKYLLCASPTAALRPGSSSFTWWGWIYQATNAPMGFAGSWDANKQEWIVWYAGTYWNLALSSNGTTVTSIDYDRYAPTLGAWGFFVAQYDSVAKVVRLQMNNAPARSVSYTNGIYSGNGGFRVGSVGSAAYMNGRLDEIGMIKSYLNRAELSILWNYGLGLPYPFVVDRNPLVVFDGDSIVRGLGVTLAGNMPSQFETLSGTSYHVVNEGVDGKLLSSIVTDAAARIDPLLSIQYFKKNIYVLQCGTNDLYNSLTGVYNNIVSICQARRTAGWKIVVSTILPRKDGALRADFETDRQTLNAQIIANYATFADGLSDIGADATIGQPNSPDNTTYYQADKVHTTAAADTIIAGIHKAAIDTI